LIDLNETLRSEIMAEVRGEATMEEHVTAEIDDPIASASGQFPLAAPSGMPPSEDEPSPVGVRPWGLRHLTTARTEGRRVLSGARYDHDQQLTVDPSGIPLITMGPPTATTTSSVDGEDPPSSEDWDNDFHQDEPFRA
jgi:putative ATP-grasp target RiPP